MFAEPRELFSGRQAVNSTTTENLCVHQLFEARAAQTPDALAATFEGERLSYGELNRRANQLAHHLRAAGVRPESLCGIYLERGLEMLVGILGILKAGGTYVPLDPTYPRERLEFMLADTRMRVLLTREVSAEFDAPETQTIHLDSERENIARQDERNPDAKVSLDNPAYAIYTSGSTGRPKGVLMTHRALSNLLAWAGAAHDRRALTLQFASLSFDVSFQEIFHTLCEGGTLVLIPESLRRDARALWQLLVAEKIERLFLPPVWLQQLAEVATNQETMPDSLREVITAGEQLRITPQIARLFERLRECRLHNHYGPSESHVVTAYTLSGAARDWPVLPPIGRPITGAQIHLLDERLRPVPNGEIGELYIGGSCLARGYLNRPDLTAERFLPDAFGDESGARLYRTGDEARFLPDGNLEFLGRSDHQVKIRGFRIEPTEIEDGLSHHPLVREAVVTAIESGSGVKRLVAYLTTKDSSVLPASEVRDFLREILPEHLIPSAFVFLDALPLTPSGKIDRRALPAPDQQRPELKEAFKAPGNQLEAELKEVWEDLLEIRPIGVRDNFFELGGDSLLAVQLLTKIQEQFDKNLSASVLIREATIEHLANAISSVETKPWSSLVEIQAGGALRPFFLVHDIGGDIFGFGPLARSLGVDQPVYGLQARGLDGMQQPFREMEAMAAYYIEEILKIQRRGPYLLGGYSLGGVIAFEIAQQLCALGHQVALLAVLDEPAPLLNGEPKWRPGAVKNILRNFPYWMSDHVWRRPAREVFAAVKRNLGRITRKGARFVLRPFGVKPYEERVADMLDVEQLPETRLQIIEALHQVSMNYRPQVYPGRVTLFRTRSQPLFDAYGKDKGWSKLAAEGVEVRVVSGNHLNLYEEPFVHDLAQAMLDSLKRIQQ
ncbi:MAG TPA: amino acid adenylation domain-containing protein [Pyrinomonadaceae bacterium]